MQRPCAKKTATIDLLTDNITGGLKMSEDDDDVHAVLRQRGSGAHARLHHRRADGGERRHGGGHGACSRSRAGARRCRARCFAEGPTYETEYRARRKDGTLAWVLDSGRKVQTEDGAVKIGSVLGHHVAQGGGDRARGGAGALPHRAAQRYRRAVRIRYRARRAGRVRARPARTAARFPSVGSALPEMIAEGGRIHPDDCERLAERCRAASR
ncbi:MAG: PAS domain-containing protein [Eggerthellaceae bacterium]